MKLDNNYRIERLDESNIGLIKIFHGRVNSKTNKPIMDRVIGYYPSLRIALKAYLDKSIKPTDSVIDLYNQIDDLYSLIDNMQNVKY